MLRSYLYVPADRQERVDKAWAIAIAGGPDAPDALILDLEDSVAPERKDIALKNAAKALQRTRPGNCRVLIRVNSGPRGNGDIVTLRDLQPDGFYVPKAAIGANLPTADVPTVRLLESAAGLRDAYAIAALASVQTLAIGEADLCGELGIAPSAAHALWPLRMTIVAACAAAQIDPPTGPVYTNVHDLVGLRITSLELSSAGFAARAAIHPAQVATINQVFKPSAQQIVVARELVDGYDRAVADGVGVYVHSDGRMIDQAVVRSARRILAE